MVDASETQENPVIESETQAVSEGEEIYEYEYVELEEGQELPEGYEYEYVEVDENGNPIEAAETEISTENGGQFLEAGQGEVSLDTLLGDEPEAAEVYPYFSRSPRLIREKPFLKLESEAAPEIGGKPE